MSFKPVESKGATLNHGENTDGFTFNHTMLRVKDPEISLDFYTRILGMTLVRKVDFPEWKFTLYFLAMLRGDEVIPDDDEERKLWVAKQAGILELTHNWGSENDSNCQYHNGNSEPRGFGHICISVPNLEAAVKWFDENQVPFQKRPEEGAMRDIAFIRDPDQYWVEVIQYL